MNITTFFNKHLTKTHKAKCNSLGKRYRRLEKRAEKDESDSFYGSDEPSVIRDRIIEILNPAVKRYAKELFKSPIRKDDEFFEFGSNLDGDYMEIFCVKRGKKGWVASVVTSYLHAPESTCDDSTCVPTPADAFAWGFGDAMAYHFIGQKVK